MFDKMYLDSISKVKPDDKLIERTKELMNNEKKNRKIVKNINFYKYATFAACAIVFIFVFALYPKNLTNNLKSDNASVSDNHFATEENIKNYFDTTDSFSKPSYSNDNFNYFEGLNGDIGGMTDVNFAQESNSFLDWIKAVIQWFYELLF